MLRRICSANICSSLFVIVSFSPNRKLATPHRKRAYVRPRLKIATAATMVPEAQRHSGEADQPRSRPRRARTNANTFPLSFAHNPKVDMEELINQVAAAAIAWNALQETTWANGL